GGVAPAGGGGGGVGVPPRAPPPGGRFARPRLLRRREGERGRVVRRLVRVRGVAPPQLAGPDPGREPVPEAFPVDQPVGLRVTADERGGKEHVATICPGGLAAVPGVTHR